MHIPIIAKYTYMHMFKCMRSGKEVAVLKGEGDQKKKFVERMKKKKAEIPLLAYSYASIYPYIYR